MTTNSRSSAGNNSFLRSLVLFVAASDFSVFQSVDADVRAAFHTADHGVLLTDFSSGLVGLKQTCSGVDVRQVKCFVLFVSLRP